MKRRAPSPADLHGGNRSCRHLPARRTSTGRRRRWPIGAPARPPRRHPRLRSPRSWTRSCARSLYRLHLPPPRTGNPSSRRLQRLAGSLLSPYPFKFFLETANPLPYRLRLVAKQSVPPHKDRSSAGSHRQTRFQPSAARPSHHPTQRR